MDFEDAVLVRLADESTRSGLFDQSALQAIALAGYDQPDLRGPYAAVFDSVELAVDLSARISVSGGVRHLSEALPYEVELSAGGLTDAAPPVTAVWRGAVTARYRLGGEPITAAVPTWTSTGPDPSTSSGGIQITFAEPTTVTTEIRRLPVTAALLARETGTGVAALLRDSAVVRERLIASGAEPAADPGLSRRYAVVVVWLVPDTVFDDEGWPAPPDTDPAQLPAARRVAASAWLERSGIALVPTAVPTSPR